MMNEAQASVYLGLSRSTLRQSRMNGIRKHRFPPPPYVRLGRTIRYIRSDLDDWIQKHRIVNRIVN